MNNYKLIKGIPEHIMVVEEYIKRPLRKNEVVHHINQNKKDNRISNLMVFQSQKEHAAFHVKMKKFPYFTRPMLREINNRWAYLKLIDKGKEIWDSSKEERGEPVRKLCSPSPLDSLNINTNSKLINVMKDKGSIGISKNSSIEAKGMARKGI